MLNKLIFKAAGLATLLVFILVPFLLAGTTGKIAGVVKDKDTGETLPGVNVLIKGTILGAAANPKGEYFVTNVPVGTYTLIVTMLGYVPMEVKNVKVSADLTTSMDFELTTQAIDLGEKITVTAERPLVIQDQTSSIRIFSNEEIVSLPTRGYQQVASLQAGVVEDANRDIFIRGGRSNEIDWVIDGFSHKDPLLGTRTTSINQNAIEEVEVVTGGFNAEYGKAMSGAVNVITKEGGIKYTGSVEAVTDNQVGEWFGAEVYDYNLYALSLGGPIFPKSGKHTFYFSGEKRWQRDREPRATVGGPLPNNSLDGWTWHGKLSFKLSDMIELKMGTLGSFDSWREYLNEYRYNQLHMPKHEDLNHSLYTKINHTINKSTFYNLGVYYYMTQRVEGDGNYFDDLRSYGRAVLNPRYDPEALFWAEDDPSTPVVDTTIIFQGQEYQVIKGGQEKRDSVVNGDTLTFLYGDEGHVYGDFLKSNSKYWGIKFDMTNQVNTHHQIRFGGSFEYHTLRRYHHLMPYKIFSAKDTISWFQDVDAYGYEYNLATNEFSNLDKGIDGAKHPKVASLYFQDKIEYQGAVVNAGVRFDYLNTDTDALRNESIPLDPDDKGPTDPLSAVLDPGDLEPSKAYRRLSPRIGVGFPITDRTLFHVSYGTFFQLPNLEDLYVSYRYLEYKIGIGGYYFAFGNPNLRPEQTTAYEVGFTHQISNNAKFDLTAFYKDVKDLIEVQNIYSYPNNFASFRNADYGTIKGLDFSFTLRRTRGISANVNYTLSYATGTGSASDTQRNIAWAAGPGIFPPKMTSPLDFDQRHKLVLNLDLRAKKGEGPVWGNIRPLENTGVNLVFNVNSGQPYTPTAVYKEVTIAAIAIENPGKINSKYGPWTYRLDLKADKSFHYRNLGIEFYFWVINLLDRDNALTVYTGTGSPNTTGWLATPEGQSWLGTPGTPEYERRLTRYLAAERNPTNYDFPRMVRFGMKLSF